MADFTLSHATFIAAPVHDVFEHCRDPRHIFEGWPELEVTDVVMTPEGVGTRAHIVGRFAKGLMVEQIEREYTEFVPDKRIVTMAHGKVRVAGRNRAIANLPIFTLLFEARGGGTELTLVALEQNLGWLQHRLESASAGQSARKLQGMLAAVKAGVENQVPSVA